MSPSEIADIEARYGIYHTDSPTVYLAELTVRPDPNLIEAFGPPDLRVRVATKGEEYSVESNGHAELIFGQPAKYYPTLGQTGYYYASCDGASVDGLGWPFGVPGDTGSHTNVVVRFARKGAEPPPVEDDGGWFGEFANTYRADPTIGKAVGEIAYLPSDWVCAAQAGEKSILVWTGAKPVQVIPRS